MREKLRRVNEHIYSRHYAPRWGWHDDHRATDRTPEYLPALMQVKGEFTGIVAEIYAAGLNGGNALQLGMGESCASHNVWRFFFEHVTTISLGESARDQNKLPGLDTHSQQALQAAQEQAPYDFLLIDAGHGFDDVRDDHDVYGPLVRKGGIIAFHDALPRIHFPEVGVPDYLERLRNRQGMMIYLIGTEVGIAWTYAP